MGGRLLLVLAVCVCAALCAPKHGAYIWQGFDHTWERAIAGLFKTPHRLGTFSNYIANESVTSANGELQASAESKLAFTPGVDGDVSFPTTFYSVVHSDNLYFAQGEETFSFTDDAEVGPNPVPSTAFDRKVVIDLAQADIPAGLDTYDVVMRGFSMQMHCDDAKQPEGHPCNSNGMWPIRMLMRVADCSAQAGQVQCSLQLNITRAWTFLMKAPLLGKAFNYRLDFNVSIAYTVVAGNSDVFTSTPHDGLIDERSIHKHFDSEDVQDTGAGPNTNEPITAVTALSGFDLQLTGHAPMGRYMEGLAFYAQDEATTKSGAHTFKHVQGYNAPFTVETATATTTAYFNVLRFASPVDVRSGGKAASPVCFSGLAWDCVKRGYEERTETTAECPLPATI